METIQGYAVTAGVGSVPLWAHELGGWLQLLAIAFAVLVGASTFYLNIMRIVDKRRRVNHAEE